MRCSSIIFAFLLAATAFCFAKEKSIPELVQEAQSAKLDHQPKLYTRIAELQLRAADKLYEAGNANAAGRDIEDVRAYSTKAVDAALRSNKQLKDTEISLRKMEYHLLDMRESLDYQSQASVKAVADDLDALRGKLLSAMFGKKVK
jgi:hypothetical protein